jgi:2-dehydropantoate 2-reductase
VKTEKEIMASEKVTVGVIGLGPVGSILAAHLAKNGVDVAVEDVMQSILLKIKQDGINISGITKFTARIGKIANSIPELAKFDPEIIFIATKACFLKPVLSEIKQVYKPKMKIVSFQNGLDNEQLIAEQLKINTAYRVVVNYAGNLISPGNVSMNWFQPPNYVGALHKGKYIVDETTRKIAEMLTRAGLKTEEAADIKKHLWEKAILNSALCSICAVTGQTMKEAMEFPYSRKLAIKILEEGLQVAKADGYDFGSNALAKLTSYLEKGGAHKPSMLIDVENRRPTEVDFLSGAITRYGEKYNIPTPVNATFTDLLKTIENRYLNP